MYKISPNLYTQLANELFESITSLSFYTGVIEFEYDDTDIRFVSTLIPYFRPEFGNETTEYILYDIIPVWWEIHTTTLDGEEINDFDFTTFKEYICQ
ncbi:MAG: hypothetical protein SNF68_02765 [Rikenellaceae bacterium]